MGGGHSKEKYVYLPKRPENGGVAGRATVVLGYCHAVLLSCCGYHETAWLFSAGSSLSFECATVMLCCAVLGYCHAGLLSC